MRFVIKMIVFPFWLLTAFLALMLKWTLNLSAFVLDGIEKQEILKIEFAENVYFIKDHTFEGCHNLTEITWGV